MLKYRKLLISILLLASAAVAAWYLLAHRRTPPLAIRLLPEGDFLLYADLRPVHLLGLQPSKPIQVEGDYQQFMAQTGIQLERDLEEVAMSRRDTADGRDVESSEVFIVRFDRSRLTDYLRRNASQAEDYRGYAIYSIPNQGHTVRVCILDNSTVAVTNMASPEPMHGIISSHRQPAHGPSLLTGYYERVPLGSLAWIIDRIPAGSEASQLPGGLNFGFLENTVGVVSLRYVDELRLRADVVAPTEADARRVVDSAGAALAVYRSVAGSLGARGSDPDVKAALDSIQLQQKGDVATFTAAVSDRFLKKIWSEAQAESQATQESPAPAAKEAPRKR